MTFRATEQEYPEINLHNIKAIFFFFTRMARSFNGERTVFSTNGAAKTEYSNADKSSWTCTSHHTQKMTQNRLKT